MRGDLESPEVIECLPVPSAGPSRLDPRRLGAGRPSAHGPTLPGSAVLPARPGPSRRRRPAKERSWRGKTLFDGHFQDSVRPL